MFDCVLSAKQMATSFHHVNCVMLFECTYNGETDVQQLPISVLYCSSVFYSMFLGVHLCIVCGNDQ